MSVLIGRKSCFKCSTEKPLSEFYRHPMMSDGHLGKCKDCTKADVRSNRKTRREYYIDYDRRRWYENESRRAGARERQRKIAVERPEILAGYKQAWDSRNPDKRKAHTALGNAVRDGRITKKPCEQCGSKKRVHGHHDDYSKPLDVRWLCPPCHGYHHAMLRRKKAS